MPELPEGKLYTIKDKQFNFSVAVTGQELMKGLAGCNDTGPYAGMIFDFGCNFRPIMTPKGLLFPVDLAFLTEHGEIVEISRLEPDQIFTQTASVSNIFYVLETPLGFLDKHGLDVGDTISVA